MIDKTNQEYTEEKAVLVGLVYAPYTEALVEEYLRELAFLARTAGALSMKTFIQKLSVPDSKTFIGKGKLAEIKQYVQTHGISLLIFDDELSASQVRNIQEEVHIRVIDRPALILDIFASRAKTAQAKVQVELAQYQYLLPRLKGMWTHLERQGAGIGSRGPGETEIETDRRIVQDKITLLKKQLAQITKQAHTQRQRRHELIRVGLVGYTNVGKSTLMNQLAKSSVLAENKLFATLDTTTKKVVLEQTPFLLSDTVGFIRKLPHHLVESFQTTLEEARESDLLLHVVDVSHPHYEDQMNIVRQTLHDLGITDKPTICVLNKIDEYKRLHFDPWLDKEIAEQLLRSLQTRCEQYTHQTCLLLSAQDKNDIEVLRTLLLQEVKKMYQIRYPYSNTLFSLQ